MTPAAWPAFQEYKPTGIDWQAAAPEHWEVKPLFTVAKIVSEANQPELELLSVYLGQGVIRFSEVEEKRTNATSADLSKYQVVRPGNLVLNNQQAWRGSVGVSRNTGIVSPAYIVADLGNAFDPMFADYYFRTSTTVAHFLVSSKGVGTIQRNLYWPALRRCPITIPPLPEQRAIAAFLDEKCAKVDEAVRIKEEQIALLRERRQILIQQAVTRGLNPAAPMKDSGIDWIGQIPAHWEVAKLKFLSTKIVDGTHFTPTYVDEGVPFLRVTDLTNLKGGQIDWETVRRIPVKEHRELSKRANAEFGDVLLSKNGTIGITRVVDWKVECSFFVSLCLIKLRRELSPYYFVSFFGSPLVDEQLYFGSLRTSVTNLHLEKIKELLIVVPPRSEQDELVAHISVISTPFEDAIAIKEDQIAALKEYKTSLINAAVTGKIKVA